MRRTGVALLGGLAVIAAGIVFASLLVNPYVYFAGYVILQYVVIATAWNILGGYAGYVNFGTSAFFALGAYTAVALILWVKAPLPVLMLAGGRLARHQRHPAERPAIRELRGLPLHDDGRARRRRGPDRMAHRRLVDRA